MLHKSVYFNFIHKKRSQTNFNVMFYREHQSYLSELYVLYFQRFSSFKLYWSICETFHHFLIKLYVYSHFLIIRIIINLFWNHQIDYLQSVFLCNLILIYQWMCWPFLIIHFLNSVVLFQLPWFFFLYFKKKK